MFDSDAIYQLYNSFDDKDKPCLIGGSFFKFVTEWFYSQNLISTNMIKKIDQCFKNTDVDLFFTEGFRDSTNVVSNFIKSQNLSIGNLTMKQERRCDSIVITYYYECKNIIDCVFLIEEDRVNKVLYNFGKRKFYGEPILTFLKDQIIRMINFKLEDNFQIIDPTMYNKIKVRFSAILNIISNLQIGAQNKKAESIIIPSYEEAITFLFITNHKSFRAISKEIGFDVAKIFNFRLKINKKNKSTSMTVEETLTMIKIVAKFISLYRKLYKI